MPYGRRPDGIFFRMEANRAAYAQPGSLRLTACHRTMMGDHLRMNLFDEDYGVNYCGGAVRYSDTPLYRVQSTPRIPFQI